MSISPPVCLDPNPTISRLLTILNYDAKKFGAHLKDDLTIRPLEQKRKDHAILLQAEFYNTPRIESFLQKGRLRMGSSQQQRFRVLSGMEEFTGRKRQLSGEPMYGLDARKDPARLKLTSPPNLAWLQPPMTLWRTMRFEEKREANPRHVTVHILVNPSRGPLRFEVIIRIGSQPCLGDVDTQRSVFPSMPLTEYFVDQFKKQMNLEGNVCVADVSNPNAISALVRGEHPTTVTTTTATMPSPMTQIPPGGIFMGGGRAAPFASPQVGRPLPMQMQKRPPPMQQHGHDVGPSQRPRNS